MQRALVEAKAAAARGSGLIGTPYRQSGFESIDTLASWYFADEGFPAAFVDALMDSFSYVQCEEPKTDFAKFIAPTCNCGRDCDG